MGRETGLARLANDLARDLMRPNAAIYWTDLTLTAAVTYCSLWLAVTTANAALSLAAAAVCVLALYRAISFIHELTHLRSDELPGFHFGWNVLIGVPFLTPSLMYEGVHMLHHAKDRYGTARDPEYLPLSLLRPRALALFLGVALLSPVAVIVRFAIVAPIGFMVPAVRRFATARMSALQINAGFAREDFDRANCAPWLAQEIGCWIWSWTLIRLLATGVVPLRTAIVTLAIYALFALVNQIRTAAAHAWDNAGTRMSFESQFADTVNVPPPAMLPMLWAPVGLRYHALHHLLPRVPYHNLAEAHRRMVAATPESGLYRSVEAAELAPALRALLGRMRRAA